VVTIRTTNYNATCEVYTAINRKNVVFWDVTSCSLQDRYQVLPLSSGWKMDVTGFSKTLVKIYEATWPGIPNDIIRI
jgi:hypothetical protein